MRRIDERRTVDVGTAAGRRIEGVERVRGIDARARGRGFVLERHTPEAIVVHEPDGLRRISLPASGGSRFIAYVVPAGLYLVTRGLLRSRRKGR